MIHPASGNKIDVILPRAGAWATARMARRRPVRLLPDRDVWTAAPEDVILGKLRYYAEGGGDRHLPDIAGMLRVTGAGIDRAEVERWATDLGYLGIGGRFSRPSTAPISRPASAFSNADTPRRLNSV